MLIPPHHKCLEKVEKGKFFELLRGMRNAGYREYRGKENTQIKKLLKEYCTGLKDSSKVFETDIFEIIVWATYRREIGENVDLLSKEDKLKVLEVDKIAQKLAEEKKNTEVGLGFNQVVKVTRKYPIHKLPKLA